MDEKIRRIPPDKLTPAQRQQVDRERYVWDAPQKMWMPPGPVVILPPPTKQR
ncbi:MAG: hypothetical protein KGK34_09965 [Chloroflexota bacterium]|nr:hypothetical protein [Chloroflexota bacterium]